MLEFYRYRGDGFTTLISLNDEYVQETHSDHFAGMKGKLFPSELRFRLEKVGVGVKNGETQAF